MTNSRFRALEIISTRKRKTAVLPKAKISDYFGELTFNQAAMHEFLTLEAYKAVKEAIDSGKRIDRRFPVTLISFKKTWNLCLMSGKKQTR